MMHGISDRDGGPGRTGVLSLHLHGSVHITNQLHLGRYFFSLASADDQIIPRPAQYAIIKT